MAHWSLSLHVSNKISGWHLVNAWRSGSKTHSSEAYCHEVSIKIIIIMMIDILYFVESESSINAAIYIIQTLYQCDIGVKLEAVRQVGSINILSFFFKTVIIIILSVLSFHLLSNLTAACLLQPFLTYRWSNWIVMGHWRCKWINLNFVDT